MPSDFRYTFLGYGWPQFAMTRTWLACLNSLRCTAMVFSARGWRKKFAYPKAGNVPIQIAAESLNNEYMQIKTIFASRIGCEGHGVRRIHVEFGRKCRRFCKSVPGEFEVKINKLRSTRNFAKEFPNTNQRGDL